MGLTDTFRHKGMRKKMVEIVKAKGIQDAEVLRAMEVVPRHLFAFESAFIERAYEDSAFPIGEGQTISQPYTVAYQTQLLELKKGDKVLEVGTGSGYQACMLAEMKARVFTIERMKNLYEKTKALIPSLGYAQVKCFYGDGYEGLSSFAPFDKILVTAAAPFVPEKLLGQLKAGGMLVIPVGSGDMQMMKRFTKISNDEIKEEVFDTFKFVPLLPGKKG
ncbi:MAG TPA: protein-L-isoaspartate(D-aspartate) O-methyltransferase [Chitinophagales bacterium]|nr:protein-L-isoaspartate(D-aspartate) O-methyltransferase [Chitinophagales bacterium]